MSALLLLVIMTAVGSAGSFLLTWFGQQLDSAREHKIERLKAQAQIDMARALSAAKDDGREDLAKQLLAAYDEAGEGLTND